MKLISGRKVSLFEKKILFSESFFLNQQNCLNHYVIEDLTCKTISLYIFLPSLVPKL